MENAANTMGDAFMEVVTKKLERHEAQLAALEEKSNAAPDFSEVLQGMVNRIDDVKNIVTFNQLTAGKLQELSTRLSSTISLLQQPVENNVQHHHHVPKLLWASVGLLLALSLVSAGWYVTVHELDGYVANDTKYRRLKLDTANKGLQKYLYAVDSLYWTYPNMRDVVLKQEDEWRQNATMLERAKRMESEANALKENVHKKKAQKRTAGSTALQ